MKASNFFWLNLIPLACVISAAVMAIYDKPDWGWFLLVAVLFAVVPAYDHKPKE